MSKAAATDRGLSRSRWIVLLAWSGVALFGQPVYNVPDLSGFWERTDEVGAGSFGALNEKVIPKAVLKTEIVQVSREAGTRQQKGDIVSFGSRWCMTSTYPALMQDSASWSILQSHDEVVQVPELHSFPRHIYVDGRTHPDTAHLIPSPAGHAIGHWEQDTLVVDTIGFTGGGRTPGGGRIGKDTHLIERFHLMAGGTKLSVVFTWDDPSIYVKPHTYEIQYSRLGPTSYAFEEYCHADDPLQSGSVVPPPQK
jgi:hypothetical protein